MRPDSLYSSPGSWAANPWLWVIDFRRLEGVSVLRTEHTGIGWADGITWDELQRLKREAGYGSADAVEVFPADRDVVNVANIRHLWIMQDRVPFAWRREK